MYNHVATRWKKLSGEDNWKGLLDPLDLDLRRVVINYGELVQAAYDAFNYEKRSPWAGSCLYGHADLFNKVQISYPGMYRITKFIYAMSKISLPDAFILKSLAKTVWDMESNWIGYVAVATDEGRVALGRRDIVVAWRGTVRTLEWIKDLDSTLVPASEILGSSDTGGLVHRGWLSIYTSADPRSRYNKDSARMQVLHEIHRLLDEFKDEETSITITGHSLGAALGTLTAVDIVANGHNRDSMVTAFVFGSPRVGNADFAATFDELLSRRLLGVRNAPDLVPSYPLLPNYSDLGVELTIDTRKSPYLKRPGTITAWHNLECYMHGLAGWHGTDGGFRMVVDRDIALVNKSTDGLIDDYPVPVEWRGVQNKGMVKGSDGRWRLVDHEGDDDREAGPLLSPS